MKKVSLEDGFYALNHEKLLCVFFLSCRMKSGDICLNFETFRKYALATHTHVAFHISVISITLRSASNNWFPNDSVLAFLFCLHHFFTTHFHFHLLQIFYGRHFFVVWKHRKKL